MTNLAAGSVVELRIEQVGVLGDGIGNIDGMSVFVPFTCVGDVVQAEVESISRNGVRARLIEVLHTGTQRQSPACMHFTRCGGCSLQHLEGAAYHASKLQPIQAMASRLGLDACTVQAPLMVGVGKRRRAELKIAVHKGRIDIGFFEAKSHQLVDIVQCPVMEESMVRLLPLLRETIGKLKKPGMVTSLSITRLAHGIDLLVTVKSALSAADREIFSRLHDKAGCCRISMKQGDEPPVILHGRDQVMAAFGAMHVELPVGAFLQATQEGQVALTDFILEHSAGFARIADLYSGCGTYSFPLHQAGHRVTAFEGDYDMVIAINNAIRTHQLEDRMVATPRDLFADPLSANELQAFDAVVINPPRNGAESQIREIAKSGVRRVVMASCNPTTFERDAKHLLNAGYRMQALLPIDQFLWSTHMELVASFDRVAS